MVRHLAPFLVSNGHEAIVYGRSPGKLQVQCIEGVEVRSTRGYDQKSSSTLTFGLSAARDLAKIGCDAALILNVANGFYLRRLRRARIPTCVNVDGLEWMRDKWGRAGRRVFLAGARAAARNADALIYDSEALAEIWSQRFGRTGHFIPYGAPVLKDVGSQRLKKAKLPVEGFILVVARIVPENNVDLLLDALPLLTGRPDVVIVGSANYRHGTAARLASLAEAGRIHWLGHVDDQELLNELWANAGVYWHGHSVGGTNPALLQALGAGAPAIALDSPFNREVVQCDDQLVQPDPSALADRLELVLASAEIARRFRRRGQETVRLRYSWKDVCQSYLSLLEGLAVGNVADPIDRASGTPSGIAHVAN